MANTTKALIVQSDRTLLLDVHCENAEDARQAIIPFAELEKSPEHIHTYRITPLSLWNAASAGLTPKDIVKALKEHTRYEIPDSIIEGFSLLMSRYGKIRMIQEGDDSSTLFLQIDDEATRLEIGESKALKKYLTKSSKGFLLPLVNRGTVKRELIRIGWPVKDEAPLAKGEDLEIKLRDTCVSGRPFVPRDYQVTAATAFGGHGVIVLPCGSGKTIVGMQIMAMLKTNTLILTTNVAAVHQWIDELLDKTELTKEQIAEYSGDNKSVAPVTVATYQIISWRPEKDGDFPHFKLFRERAWGLVIYDEVHLLPAPVFRVTAELQAIRRLGLTATLIREDGEEDAVFSLVGPKRYDVPWKDLETKGWIAEALCTEIRLDLPQKLRIAYATAPKREKYRIAAENPLKEDIVLQLILNHKEEQILVIGQYLTQLDSISKLLNAPLITGKTPNAERERIYSSFKKGEVRVIVVSKVANFAIDLPDASMAVQVSGSFGSRQEEAQRLGRILRPKAAKSDNSWFFSLVSGYTVEEEFAANRQKFLTEQGYKYAIQKWEINNPDSGTAK
ncbi:MAG: DEAD/DEAH box helicase [Treponema sp.]|nr:DEAD/DEAH box helicase [Treponema sp.]MCL2237459.1 DEAD/DEAH box helicase [Treponema sp.]